MPILGAKIIIPKPKDKEFRKGTSFVIEHKMVRNVLVAQSELDREQWIKCINFYEKNSKTSKDTDDTFKNALNVSKSG